MKKEIATLFVTALRSGKYTKGTGSLVKKIPKNANGDTHAFCATGVLCHIAAAVGIVKRVKSASGGLGYVAQNALKNITPSTGTLPQAVLNWAGMRSANIKGGVTPRGGRPVAASLESLNDAGLRGHPWSFAQLANLIEKRYADIGA